MTSDSISSSAETTSGRWSARLTPERIKQMAACLITGCTRQETADELRVSPRTVTRWKKDARVLAEVERLRNGANEIRAVDVLLELLDSVDDRVRLAAAREILQRKIQRAPEEPEQVEVNVPEGYFTVRREPIT